MILYSTTNRDLEVWYLDLAGRLARPPTAPTVYALVSFEAAEPRYYLGSTCSLRARVATHISFARRRKWHARNPGAALIAPALARRRRLLIVILETCPGADRSARRRIEQAWMVAAARDTDIAALSRQAASEWPSRATGLADTLALAAARHWPSVWLAALGPFFREERETAGNAQKTPRIRKAKAKGAPVERKASVSPTKREGRP